MTDSNEVIAEATEEHKHRIAEAFESAKKKAEEMLKDDGELEAFLVKLEQKMAEVPVVGEELAHVPALASLLRSHVAGEYALAPIGSVVAILGALIYWVSPIDVIPDFLPAIGYADDALVVAICWSLVSADVQAYQDWRTLKQAEED
ncbi:MAG: YkvA family protein [Coriobacteriia bacterium]|nr:YkvA family protein [Coriobacteriia bacterium]